MLRLHLKRTRVAVLGAALAAFASLAGPVASTSASAPADCQFVLGFQTFNQLAPDVVGPCTSNQTFAANGDAVQMTTHGMLVWRKSDNFTAFTDGTHTWLNGPNGIQERLNSERFPWETPAADARSGSVVFAAGRP